MTRVLLVHWHEQECAERAERLAEHGYFVLGHWQKDDGSALTRGIKYAEFPRAAASLADQGSLWIAWPKQASGVVTDLSDSVVREFGLAQGLVDTKVCAIDTVWSGLRFSRRRVDKLR